MKNVEIIHCVSGTLDSGPWLLRRDQLVHMSRTRNLQTLSAIVERFGKAVVEELVADGMDLLRCTKPDMLEIISELNEFNVAQFVLSSSCVWRVHSESLQD